MTDKYYDDLAPFYKLIYPDWDKSLQRQSRMLDDVIREFIGTNSKTVLDAACGIGTQSIGLAKLGYHVTASDLSPGEIEVAKQEALRYGVDIEFQIVDMRRVWDFYQKQFDIVIACDNSVPHLLNDDEILSAFKQFYQCTAAGGACLISVRDYAQLEKKHEQEQMYPRLVHQTADGQVVIFDMWKFEGQFYEMTTYIVHDTGNAEAKTQVLRGGKYYCVEISTLEELFRKAGFHDVITLRERFFQPLILARK